ncbi:uncharacterized protein BJ212DRAFT_1299092 [Suillus subaureus]|uniref:Uncharacterized protein n=1 Tax=Suillus subaureus TaxID=48587 RepID=A0A9P7JEG5_9AGAM|nr:uncharacterized protein BJ212DRAFT_1299092 [Suillus subaureus]KAG1817539.1 hypothetical protein BJ212DRAFT_1299092 [Suillus subaureus]
MHKVAAAVDRLEDKYTETITQFVANHFKKKDFSVKVSLWSPGQVQIIGGKYKGNITYVFDPNQTNKFIRFLIPPMDFPYLMPKGSMLLFNRSHIPANQFMTDINIKPGDSITMRHCEKFQLSQSLLIKIPIRFTIKVHNATIKMFYSHIGKEVYIIGGKKRGYRVMQMVLCTTKCPKHNTPPERLPPSRVNPVSVTPNPWAVNNSDIQDIVNTTA